MDTTFKSCITEDEYAKVSVFLLDHKYDLHPSFSTLQMVELLYVYMTKGTLFYGALPDGQVIAASAYYQGTPERDFADNDVVLIDIAILDRPYRRTRQFLHGLQQLIAYIHKRHPEVQEVRFAALSDNRYLIRLYSKFADYAYTREGSVGEETIFCQKITQLWDALDRFHRL